ncbi:MAG TPA: hypothetical protein VHZ78_08600 [Rhizomicrobium sp.]|jgi:hypothetical protein|nr:hypothetical protein [Rhizomicrobium sp.]
MSKLRLGLLHTVMGLAAVADAFSGTVYSDVVKIAEYGGARFIIHKGVGLLGTSTITVEACDNANGDNPVAVVFSYQAYTGADDLPGAVATVTTAGFTTTAGSNHIYVIDVDPQKMGSKAWLRLKAVEVVNDPVLGGILIELYDPRFASSIPPDSAIA